MSVDTPVEDQDLKIDPALTQGLTEGSDTDQSENADLEARSDNSINTQVPGHVYARLKEQKKEMENQLKGLQAQVKERKVQEAEEKEDWRNLYEDTKAERDQFKADAERFQKIENARKERILESFPENLRDKISTLDSETLEQMQNEFNNKVPQVDNSGGGVSGGKIPSWKDMSPQERKRNFADLMRFKK